MKKILFIFICFILVNSLYAQKVTQIRFYQDGQQIVILYNLTGAKYFQLFNVSVYVSTDGGNNYIGPLKKVNGDIGLNVTPGIYKKIIWDVFEEMPDFGGKVSFEVRAVVNKEKPKRKIFIGYKGSYLAPVGLMVGITGKTGFYISSRINLMYLKNVNSDYYKTEGTIIQNYNNPGYYSFTSNYNSGKFSITGGLSLNLSRNLMLYMGGGYAENNLFWEIAQFDYNNNKMGEAWVKNTKKSYSFFEAESGLWLKINPLFLSAGISVCGNKWIDGTVSAGIIF